MKNLTIHTHSFFSIRSLRTLRHQKQLLSRHLRSHCIMITHTYKYFYMSFTVPCFQYTTANEGCVLAQIDMIPGFHKGLDGCVNWKMDIPNPTIHIVYSTFVFWIDQCMLDFPFPYVCTFTWLHPWAHAMFVDTKALFCTLYAILFWSDQVFSWFLLLFSQKKRVLI